MTIEEFNSKLKDKLNQNLENKDSPYELFAFESGAQWAKELLDVEKREVIQDFANWNNQQYATTISVYPMVRVTEADVERFLRSIS